MEMIKKFIADNWQKVAPYMGAFFIGLGIGLYF